MLKKGRKLPKFSAILDDGTEIDQDTLTGDPAVIFSYSKDGSPTCTTTVRNMVDSYNRFSKAGYKVYGISQDSIKRHSNFRAKENIPFNLIADKDAEVLQKLGFWGEKNNFGRTYMGVIRGVIILNEKGMVSDVLTGLKSTETAENTLKQLKKT